MPPLSPSLFLFEAQKWREKRRRAGQQTARRARATGSGA